MNSSIKTFILVVFFTLLATACNNQSSQADNETTNTPSKVVPTEPNDDGEIFVQGGDYDALPVSYDTENSEQVVVYEFFGYTCPHCFTFEPFINKWLETKPDYVKLVRVPLNFQPNWANFQQAYLTAQVMGIVEETHSQLFEAIHKDHKRINTMDEIASWYAETTGVDKEVFISTSDSFILDSKLRKADNMGFNMQITSTPALVINGKFKAAKGKTRDEIMQILDYLIEKEAKSMGIIK